ncbi:MAG: hypothetical protein ACRDWG_07305 [Actinomycetes bacterium]
MLACRWRKAQPSGDFHAGQANRRQLAAHEHGAARQLRHRRDLSGHDPSAQLLERGNELDQLEVVDRSRIDRG